jgi:hypothetical protein
VVTPVVTWSGFFHLLLVCVGKNQIRTYGLEEGGSISEPKEPFRFRNQKILTGRLRSPWRDRGSTSSGIRVDHTSSVDFRKKEKEETENSQAYFVCVTDSQHNVAKKMRAAFSQPCCREGDVRASCPIGNNGSSAEKRT